MYTYTARWLSASALVLILDGCAGPRQVTTAPTRQAVSINSEAEYRAQLKHLTEEVAALGAATAGLDKNWGVVCICSKPPKPDGGPPKFGDSDVQWGIQAIQMMSNAQAANVPLIVTSATAR